MKVLILALAMIAFANLAYGTQDHPFSKYPSVGESIFVERTGLFRAYSGAPPKQSTEEAEDDIRRVRLGTVTAAPDADFVIEEVSYPLSTNYEMRVPETGAVVHVFSYGPGDRGKLLFTGRGVVFEFAGIGLCQGSATRKYEFVGGKLLEVSQPFLYINEQTSLRSDVRIYSSSVGQESPVALLQKGTTVTVIGAQQGKQNYLIKTPLGLTGWLSDSHSRDALNMRVCN